jgi:hypothetical protein
MKGELDRDGKPYWWWTCVRFLLYCRNSGPDTGQQWEGSHHQRRIPRLLRCVCFAVRPYFAQLSRLSRENPIELDGGHNE